LLDKKENPYVQQDGQDLDGAYSAKKFKVHPSKLPAG
jgi:hypothetical protein